MNKNYFSEKPSPKNQKGIATILLVVLISIALLATSFGVMHSLRSTQEKHVAAHAVTHAQTGVWAGVEAFRRYLGSIDSATLDALDDVAGAEFPITLTTAEGAAENRFGSLQVSNITVAAVGGVTRVTATVTNTNANAQASASVGVVIEVEPPGPPPSVQLEAAMNFHDNLEAGGQITITTPANTLATINVDGSAILPEINITQMQAINATGVIELNSQVTAQQIHSNSDVRLSGSAKAHTVWARGDVTIGSGGSAADIWANGNVAYTSSEYYRDPVTGDAVSRNIQSQSSITSTTVGWPGNDVLIATGDINIDKEAGGGTQSGTYAQLESASDIYIRNINATVTSLSAEGNLLCPNSSTETWTSDKFSDITVGGTIGRTATQDTATDTPDFTMECSAAKDESLKEDSSVVTGDSTFVATAVPEVPVLTIPKAIVDVWAIKRFANYVIDRHESRTRITTYNVNGFTDGTSYYLGNYSGDNYKSYLCTDVDDSGTCTAPAKNSALGTICLGGNVNDPCLFYESIDNRDTWKFDGKGMAPGIYFIDGDLILANGVNHATVLVSGNVSTSNSLEQYAVNYGAYAAVCEARGSGIYSMEFTNRYSVQRPTNLCTAGTFNGMDVGNIGIAAGGYRPSDNGAFSGGDIFLGSNTKVNGMVLAGGYLSTGGQITVNGYLNASVQGGKALDKKNELKENTTMNLNNFTDTYTPNQAPDMSGGACNNCTNPGAGGGGNAARATLRWSKYL